VRLARVRATAYPKLNLSLRVLGRRPDGYHDLVTVFQALSITDEVSVTPAVPGAVEPGVAVSPIDGVDASEVPADTTNLAWRAVEALARRADRTPDVRIGLRKAIPVAGGISLDLTRMQPVKGLIRLKDVSAIGDTLP